MWAIRLRVRLRGCVVGCRHLGIGLRILSTLHACRDSENERVHLGALGLLPRLVLLVRGQELL